MASWIHHGRVGISHAALPWVFYFVFFFYSFVLIPPAVAIEARNYFVAWSLSLLIWRNIMGKEHSTCLHHCIELLGHLDQHRNIVSSASCFFI